MLLENSTFKSCSTKAFTLHFVNTAVEPKKNLSIFEPLSWYPSRIKFYLNVYSINLNN